MKLSFFSFSFFFISIFFFLFCLVLIPERSSCFDPKEAPKPRGHSDEHGSVHAPPKPSATPPRYVSPPVQRQSRAPWKPKMHSETLTAAKILAEHSQCKTPTRKNWPNPGETLVYVTPWNSEGYDVAKLYKSKFTYISPVWIQLRPNEDKKTKENFVLTGLHDVDQGWIHELRKDAITGKGGRPPLIVPRVAFEGWQPQHFQTSFSSSVGGELVALILKEVRKQNFDGIVLEGLLNFRNSLRETYFSWLISLSKALHNDGRLLILVVSPGNDAFNAKDFNQLAPHIDRFSLMTYDYTIHRGQQAGPNAPYKWIHDVLSNILGEPQTEEEEEEEEEAVEKSLPLPHQYAHKILLGLNFYGYDFGARRSDPIIGKRLLEVLKEQSTNQLSIQWDSESREHKMIYQDPKTKETHQIWFPTLRSIQWRLLKAYEFGTGLSVWEIGQGLRHFYDLL